jgi:hypothetical protein
MPAQAVAQQGGASGEGIVFDIPAQPLASALDAYSAVTGKDVFYDGTVGTGQQSAEVEGTYTPDDALRILLAGTSLLAQPSGSNGYSLLMAPEETGAAIAMARTAADQSYTRYFAIIQAGIRDALCRNARTQPGSYRLLLRFWIGPSGAVQRSELKGSTGSPVRDSILAGTLRAVRFAEPPPDDMPQPITMAIYPWQAAGPTGCPSP